MEVNKIGPEWVPELKKLSSPQKGEISKAGEKPERGDKVSISDEAKILQKAREIAQGRSLDLGRIRQRLKEGYYDREDVLREVVDQVLSELLGL